MTLPKGGASSVMAQAPPQPLTQAFDDSDSALVVDLGRLTPRQRQTVDAGYRGKASPLLTCLAVTKIRGRAYLSSVTRHYRSISNAHREVDAALTKV